MKTALIVINYNDSKDTINLINSVKEYESINRIVIVDNMSSEDGGFEKIKLLGNSKVAVIKANKNGGYNYGINVARKFLKQNNEEYDYFIISNPDIEVEESAIIKSLDVISQNNDIALVAPRMFNKENLPIRRSAWKLRTYWRDVIHSTRFLELLFYKKFKEGEYSSQDFSQDILEVEAISGSFFAIKCSVIDKIGLLDENIFLFYEEDILGKKIKELGKKIISLNTEKFIHYESQTIGKVFNYFSKTKELFKSRLYYQINYNKIGLSKIILLYLLFIFRNVELLVEVPVRKMLKK